MATVLRNIFALALVFYVLTICKSSMVTLNDGGYEDIVIAINPRIGEDLNIIEKIKDMVKEATGYLFHATKKRLYIRNVKILIPSSWTGNNYTKPKTETYDKADIKIANPSLKYGNDPYTQQYRGCGEQGEFIHFTPDFMTDDKLLSVYGPRGRLFVHEWAHLRWGVFDEYSLDKPYYIASNLKVEATRCSVDIFGKNTVQICKGSVCTIRECDFNPDNGLYEDGCVFVPDKSQFVTESIMYNQALPDVTEFCDASNHNTEAPNLQNEKCRYRSTWDIIMNSTDIISTPPRPEFSIPDPTFTLLQPSERILTLVLDVSGSMGSYGRIQRLYQAADVFLIQIIETNSFVGMVKFSSTASVSSQLVQIRSDVERKQLKGLLPTTASGGTHICAGILAGIQVNKGNSGSAAGTEILLLSDGEDNYDTRLCFSEIINSGAVIHVIFLGLAEEPNLKEIAKDTGGNTFLATDTVDTNGLIDAFSAISAGNGDVTQQAIQLESAGLSLKSKEYLNGTVYIDNSIGNETFFLVTWQTAVASITLRDPKGKVYTAAQFVHDSTAKSSRLAIPGTAERGPWEYSIGNTAATVQVLGIVVNSKAVDENVPPVVVDAHMSQDTNKYPNPMIIYASVNQGLTPVMGAKVTAIVEPVSGPLITLELLDNGAGPDIVKDDGIYSKYFIEFSANGRYALKVRVESNKGKSRLVQPSNRALYVPGFIVNGSITMNPPRPEINYEDLNLGDFSRTASGGSFVVSNVPAGNQPDIYKPEKITDLKAEIKNESIVLSWTATGDDLDQGSASSYDLRMSTKHIDLQNNFDGSTPINVSHITPLPAGSREAFTFVPENIVIQNGTILYFAIIAIDKVSHKSDVSNIAQAALLLPPTPAPTTPAPTTISPQHTTLASRTDFPANKSTENINITEVTLIVCSAVIAICIIISITVCIVSCQKKKKNPATRV
ncbi:calcium-activated chloride channel regulator 4 [Pseudophryne corroboree]|uniref:calcium-activated chloride channel regulator 4 n=1 Tax=Pseudophryne corroboree TaxID=495146 RepID=UPI003081BFA2